MKKYEIYGTTRQDFEYEFDLYIGTGRELKRVYEALFEATYPKYKDYVSGDDYYIGFEKEWLDGSCSKYAIMIDKVDAVSGEPFMYPMAYLLSQRILKAYEASLKYLGINGGFAGEVNDFFDNEAYQTALIEEEDK